MRLNLDSFFNNHISIEKSQTRKPCIELYGTSQTRKLCIELYGTSHHDLDQDDLR